MTETIQATVTPLQPGDPPMVGQVLLRGRLGSSDAGIVYAGQLVDDPVAIVILTAGAETDSFGRARFEQAVRCLEADDPDAVLDRDVDREVASWAVLAAPSWTAGLATATQLLEPVTLADVASVGVARGPVYRPHWYERIGVGRWRIWPLPWPIDIRSAARWTMVAALALVVAIASLALFIVVQIFRHNVVPNGPGPSGNPLTNPVPPPITVPSVPTTPRTTPGQPPGGPSHGATSTTHIPRIV